LENGQVDFSPTAPGAADSEVFVHGLLQPLFSLTAPGAAASVLAPLQQPLFSPTAPGAAVPFLVQVGEQLFEQLAFSPTAPGAAPLFFWQHVLEHSFEQEFALTAPMLALEPFFDAQPVTATQVHSAATAKIDFMILGLLPWASPADRGARGYELRPHTRSA
jgi:hypothetical protein